MIRYHGGPITPLEAANSVWTTRHGMVSYARPDQIELVAEVCASFTLDNGAFSTWTRGERYDFDGYCEWAHHWLKHPGCDWCVIPDVIDGTEAENNRMLVHFRHAGFSRDVSVPVFHMHENVMRLESLMEQFPRVAIGSSGEFATPGSDSWWRRMCELMDVACRDGFPLRKFHGLRMMNPTIFSHVPFASVDSTNVAQNCCWSTRWSGQYAPQSNATRAIILAERMERHAAAARWSGSKGVQMNFELAG